MRIFAIALITTTGIAEAQTKLWVRTFEGTESPHGEPAEAMRSHNPHRTTDCGGVPVAGLGYYEIADFGFLGGRSFKGGIRDIVFDHPCQSGEYTLRYYPSYGGRFGFPILLSFWMYVDAEDFSFAKTRFSQATAKGTEPKAPQEQIVTTHIRGDGTMDLSHLKGGTIHNPNLILPLEQWTLQALYIDEEGGETIIKFWSDGFLVADGVSKTPWERGQIRDFHFGVYGDDNGWNGRQTESFAIYNDDMKLWYEIAGGETEAERLYSDELARAETPSEPPPKSTTSVLVSWSPNPEPDIAYYKVHWGRSFDIQNQITQVSDTSAIVVVPSGPRWYFSVSAGNTSGLESLRSLPIWIDTAEPDTIPPVVPGNVKVEIVK